MKKSLLILLTFFLQSAHGYDFRVLSWNVYMLPTPIKDSLQFTRSRAIPAALKNTGHDLIFMQEAFMATLRRKLKSALKVTHPHTYYLKNPSFPFPVEGSGLFIISRWPMKLLDHVYFHSCTDADCLASKGSALFEITLPGGQKIQVANTHLQAVRSAGQIRMNQLGQIHRMLLKHYKKEVPQFLIGDLNIDYHEPEFMMGLNLMGMDFAQITGPILWTSGRDNPCYKVGDKHAWIDHMWYDNYSGVRAHDLQVKVMDFPYEGKNCPLSDHHAVEAAFHF
jgi:endonuclease/exonuclease/phosphatase family metal-dependent hydrolase